MAHPTVKTAGRRGSCTGLSSIASRADGWSHSLELVVVPIIQASPLVVIALSAVFLPKRLERVTWRLVVAATVVVTGATLVSLSG